MPKDRFFDSGGVHLHHIDWGGAGQTASATRRAVRYRPPLSEPGAKTRRAVPGGGAHPARARPAWARIWCEAMEADLMAKVTPSRMTAVLPSITMTS